VTPGLRHAETRRKVGFKFSDKEPVKLVKQPIAFAEHNLAQEIYMRLLKRDEKALLSKNLILKAVYYKLDSMKIPELLRTKEYLVSLLKKPITRL
jgi:hypothetical protein